MPSQEPPAVPARSPMRTAQTLASSPVTKPTTPAPALIKPSMGGINFVNFTACDRDSILNGVAPSGSHRTKQRRERERREREKRSTIEIS
ncbi:hypothetical protein V1514DRAFT_335531 [Lipomyces japonicus]|uniref:uncharacterized protein n=1 Tax=Lipomyces japonicus TaxID=56871 RepID=UPI0034CE2E7D